jgi:hypothetical protein
MQTIAGINHFDSVAEVNAYIYRHYKPTEKPSTNKWLIIADKIGDMKRIKPPLLLWERRDINSGVLFSCEANTKDFIVLESVSGAKFRIYAQYILGEWTSNLHICNIKTKEQSLSGDIKVKKIYVEGNEPSEVKDDTNAYW